jgi:hypothetical protein
MGRNVEFIASFGGLHEKHAVQRGVLGTNSAFALGPRKTTKNSGYRIKCQTAIQNSVALDGNPEPDLIRTCWHHCTPKRDIGICNMA